MGKYQARLAGDVIAPAPAASTGGPGMRARADALGAPPVVFTDPQVASVGHTEEAARAEGRRVRAVEYDLGSVSGASLLADGYTGAAPCWSSTRPAMVVGATFVGQDVAELVHSATVAVVGAAHRRHAVARRTLVPHRERGLAPPARGVRPLTAPPPEIDLWDGARARAHAPGLWRGTMRCSATRTRWRSGGRRCSTGTRARRLPSGGGPVRARIVGFAYGYVGERGQPWADRVAARSPRRRRRVGRWAFELVDLAVLESHRRHGGGRRLHDVLMDGETGRALLFNDDADTPAVLLYRSRGWRRLGQLFEGVQVMGLRPPVPATNA